MGNELIKARIELTRGLGREVAQVLLEGDVLAPDVKPDMAAMLKADGDVCLDKTEAANGRVHYAGRLTIRVLYLAKGGERSVHHIAATAPLEDFINMDGVTPESLVTVTAEIASIEYRMVNDRKIGYRAVVEITCAADAQTGYDAVTGIDGLPENQMKRQTLRVNKTYDRREDRFTVKDEFTLPAGKPNIREVLQATAVIANKEAKAANGRVSVAGEIVLTALYKGDDGILEFIERELPFNGQIDAPNAKEGCYADARLQVAETSVQPRPNEDGEDRVLEVELNMLAGVSVTCQTDVDVLRDAYSTDQKLTLATQAVAYPRLVCRNKNQYPVKEIVTLDAASPEMLQILRVTGRPVVDEAEAIDDKVTVSGVIHADVLYIAESDDAPLYNHRAVIPFKQVIETKGAAPHMDVTLEAGVDHTGFNMLAGREVELRFLLNFGATVIERQEGQIVTSVAFDPIDKASLDKMAGIVIYAVRDGDTLWDIAKRYNAGVEDLADVNELDATGRLAVGQKLVVVKRVG